MVGGNRYYFQLTSWTLPGFSAAIQEDLSPVSPVEEPEAEGCLEASSCEECWCLVRGCSCEA